MCRALKPIGTITKFYPFLEQDTVDSIEAVMKLTENYRDFVIGLAKLACDEEVSTELFRFTVIQANTIGFGYDDEIWDKSRPLCENDVAMNPWFFWNNSEITRQEKEEKLPVSINSAIASHPSDWLLLHVYYTAAWQSSIRTHRSRPGCKAGPEKGR